MEDLKNTTEGEGENSRWAWIITGVVILVVAVGAYAWPRQASDQTAQAPTNTANEEVDTYTASLNNVSSSDDIADIEKDLNDTNVNDLDKETTDVDSVINPPSPQQ